MTEITVNGVRRQIDAAVDMPLLWVLRDHLNLCGTKYGCGIGVCGICTVLLDNAPARSCMVPLSAVGNRNVMTIEGLALDSRNTLIRAWVAEQVPQCGYCQPGQIMAAAAMLSSTLPPDVDTMRNTMAGVLCRCGTYLRILRALIAATHSSRVKPIQVTALSSAPRVEMDSESRAVFAPNPWVHIDQHGEVTVIIDRSEMGQGIAATLAMLVAEELEVDVDQIRAEFAPAGEAYVNPRLGEQMTGGSTSVRAAWEPLRRAGAQAREMLICAAASVWKVDPRECHAERGEVIHRGSGRRLSYGALAVDASGQHPPQQIALKSRDRFRILGRSIPRLDIPAMCEGKAPYGLDIRRPGMHVAVVARCPVFGGRPARFDAAAALAIAGVRHVLKIGSGIAVVGDDTWSALRGRQALNVDWRMGKNAELNSAAIQQRFERAGRRSGTVARDQGNSKRELRRAQVRIEATYTTPYLAHATMEPMNCTAHVQPDRCDIWVPTQAQGAVRETAHTLTGLARKDIHVHTTFLGGGFGRRLELDFVEEAVEISRTLGAPVQVVWTRQDDMRHDFYRPANFHRITCALDDDGKPIAWHQRIVGPALALEGVNLPYAIPNVREEHVVEDPGIPTGAWRSVGASQNAFAVECFIDELAETAGRDPVEYRRKLLTGSPRHLAVLDRAAEQAGWYEAKAQGRHLGIAIYHSFGSWVATIAEVTVTQGRAISVRRVICAVDCGIALNPGIVTAQMEGAVAFAMSASLYGEITFDRGQTQQSSFDDYPIVTMADMPPVEVHILDSDEPPGGVGEPGIPPVAPAIANAVFAATGARLRHLPLRLGS